MNESLPEGAEIETRRQESSSVQEGAVDWKTVAIALYGANERWSLTPARVAALALLQQALNAEADLAVRQSSPRSQPVTAKEIGDSLRRLREIWQDCQRGAFGPNLAERLWNIADDINVALANKAAPSAQPVTSASIEEAKDKVLRCLDKAFWGRTDAQAAKQWEQAVADLDALIAAVRQDEHEKHGETVIAYEGEGIAPDDVTDGYSYSAEVVRRKITAVRQGCAEAQQKTTAAREDWWKRMWTGAIERAETAESTLAALPQEIDQVIHAIPFGFAESAHTAVEHIRGRLRSFWREKGM